MYEFRLYLYISSETSNSVASAWNLKSLLDEKLKGRYIVLSRSHKCPR